MIDSERRRKLRVFLRVGTFAIAIALSAVALIRILAVSRQIQFIQQQLESAQSAGEELKRKNDQLLALNSLRDQHHAVATRNKTLVGRFYQLCREPNDLPQLKTDFIVRDHKTFKPSPLEFAFSVPAGRHSLKVHRHLIGGGQTTNLRFPLLPSSSYFVRIQTDAASEREAGQLLLELKSNNADFKPIQQLLPYTIMPADTRIVPDELYNVSVAMASRLRNGQQSSSQEKSEVISYPNSVDNLYQVQSVLESGVEIATCYETKTEAAFALRVSVVSDTPECIAAENASSFFVRGALQPYTGNGRFYIRSKN